MDKGKIIILIGILFLAVISSSALISASYQLFLPLMGASENLPYTPDPCNPGPYPISTPVGCPTATPVYNPYPQPPTQTPSVTATPTPGTIKYTYLPIVLNPIPGIQTQVIVFYPTGLSEPSRQGYCWTSSLDILRPDAWRCIDTNQSIFDPCISPLNETGYVVCDAYPLRGGDGFKLYLTQPLPNPVPIDPNLEKSFAWAFKLFDGTTCSLIQASTWPTCLPRYSCSDGLEVKDFPNPGALWMAERGQFDVNSCSLTQPVQSNIQTVWK
jgi:hypothetical protein